MTEHLDRRGPVRTGLGIGAKAGGYVDAFMGATKWSNAARLYAELSRV